MDTIYVEVCASVNGSLFYCDVEIGNKEDIKERIMEAYNDTNEETVEIDVVGDFEVVDWKELEEYENLQDKLEELSEYNGYYELDVISAAVDCGIAIDGIDDSYQGEYKSDEDFAQNMSEELGLINRDVSWPYTCIDWEWAAKELMYDYCESNGHYFRQ